MSGAGTPPRPTAADATLLEEVRSGLARVPRELPPRLFYDERGAELFAAITRLPEYYPTRTERALLGGATVRGWIGDLAPATVVELGPGSAKTRALLAPAHAAGRLELYVPVDLSPPYLDGVVRRVAAAYPGLRVDPVRADIGRDLGTLPPRPRPTLFAFLGGTLGNFAEPAAVALLARLATLMEEGDALLLGADLRPSARKPAALIEQAYDDPGGVTAEFNRNVLRHLAAATGATIDEGAFAHRAFYDPLLHRIEMHLVAQRPVRLDIPEVGRFALATGESIRTEISCKYDRAVIERLLRDAGLRLREWVQDGADRFALALASRG